MGLLLSRFKKEKTSLQLLEELQEEIEITECDKDTTVLTQKKYVGKLILYSVFLYCLFAVSFYFLAFPSTFRDGALYIAPLVIMPLIVFVAQRSIKWYFRRKLTWNTEKLADLRARKKKILDEVMDKETFRVAREILEKFAPDQLRKSEGSQLLKSSPTLKSSPSKLSSSGKEIKREESTEIKTAKVIQAPPVSSTPVALSTPQPVEPIRAYQLPNIQPSIPVLPQPPVTTHVLSPSQKRRLVRPILDPVGSRGFVDRLIEHLVGDGPANRYALICSHCSSHNGMALKEEFEYISFRCAYCGFPNPSRKVMTKRNSDVSAQEVGSSDMINTFEEKVEETSETELLPESSNSSLADKAVDENETLDESDETKEEEKEKLIPEDIDDRDTHVTSTPDSNLSN